jgi:hypothetical protein
LNAISGYFKGCSENTWSGKCGGDWPCKHMVEPMRKVLEAHDA